MTHDPLIPKKKLPSEILTGQIPRTRFKDHLSSVRVDLISGPARDIDLTAYAFQQATWRDEPYIPGLQPDQDETVLRDLKINAIQGNGLPLSLELYDFVFCISGINRVITHQVVRNRIGATYSQQCSGDKDWRHHDVLVPRSIYQNKKTYEAFKQQILASKELYANMLDSLEISIMDARKILPHCLETFIYVKFNLVTLASFIQKRDCVQTQEPEMVMVARRMREAVIAKYPFLTELLANLCKQKKCFYTRSDRLTGTSMFIPDTDHDFPYHRENFIYQKTPGEMSYDLPAVPTEQYEGMNLV